MRNFNAIRPIMPPLRAGLRRSYDRRHTEHDAIPALNAGMALLTFISCAHCRV
jgi:hypothetical protein